jgi:hypothetical protein
VVPPVVDPPPVVVPPVVDPPPPVVPAPAPACCNVCGVPRSCICCRRRLFSSDDEAPPGFTSDPASNQEFWVAIDGFPVTSAAADTQLTLPAASESPPEGNAALNDSFGKIGNGYWPAPTKNAREHTDKRGTSGLGDSGYGYRASNEATSQVVGSITATWLDTKADEISYGDIRKSPHQAYTYPYLSTQGYKYSYAQSFTYTYSQREPYSVRQTYPVTTSYQSYSCAPCPAGQSQPLAGMNSGCIPCAAGQFATGGFAICLACPS